MNRFRRFRMNISPAGAALSKDTGMSLNMMWSPLYPEMSLSVAEERFRRSIVVDRDSKPSKVARSVTAKSGSCIPTPEEHRL